MCFFKKTPMTRFFLMFLSLTLVLGACKKDELKDELLEEILFEHYPIMNLGNFQSILSFSTSIDVSNTILQNLNIVTTEQEFTHLKNAYNYQYYPPINVDFNTEMLVMICNLQSAVVYHEVNIKNVVENENEIRLSIVTSARFPREELAMTLASYPMHIYKIPKTNKNIVLQ